MAAPDPVTSWQEYVDWVRAKVRENRQSAKTTRQHHAVARGTAAIGAILVPVLTSINSPNAVELFNWSITTQAVAGGISLLVAISLALDGMIRWGDLYQSFTLATVKYEMELHAYECTAGDYRSKSQQQRDDLFFQRTSQIYADERNTRVSYFLKGTSGTGSANP